MLSLEERSLSRLVADLQAGDESARWEFVSNKKIREIIKREVRRFGKIALVSSDDTEDLASELPIRAIILAEKFKLPDEGETEKNEGSIVHYFDLRLRGEADQLIRRITGLKVRVDDGTKFFYSASEPLDEVEQQLAYEDDQSKQLDDQRASDMIDHVLRIYDDPAHSQWLQCLKLKIEGLNWQQIADRIGYDGRDATFLSNGTERFKNWLKNELIELGEQLYPGVVGIYTEKDYCSFAVCTDGKLRLLWEAGYDNYDDLSKIEAKLGDILRENDITFIVFNNDPYYECSYDRAYVVLSRFLSKRGGFNIECFDIDTIVHHMPVKRIEYLDRKNISKLLVLAKLAEIKLKQENYGTKRSTPAPIE